MSPMEPSKYISKKVSAVRHMHICRGLHNHFKQQLTPQLFLILTGIKKCQGNSRKHLPIKIQLLGKIKHVLSKEPSYFNTTWWAMCCLAFFGFLQVGEFTIPTESSYSASHHLCLQDISVDSRTNPHLLQLFLKQSKTDPFRHGAKVYIGATDTTICPIRAVLAYLAKRSSCPGPLFITEEGKGWTSSMFLQDIMDALQLNKHHYNTLYRSSNIGIISKHLRHPYSETGPPEKQCFSMLHQASAHWASKAHWQWGLVKDLCRPRKYLTL